MKLQTDALVLKTTDTGESDRLVTLLTRDYGVIRAFANRAKKFNSRLHGATQSLCYGEFQIRSGRDSYMIDDATAKEMFLGLREEILSLSLAQYFCALAGLLAPAEEPAEAFLRVLLNSLHLLEKARRSPDFLKAVTELRCMTQAGYMPELTACPHCGTLPDGPLFFSPKSGCVCCAESGRGGLRITPGVLAAMRHVCYQPIDRIYAFTLPAQEEALLARVSERFVLEQTGARISALDFYRTMK